MAKPKQAGSTRSAVDLLNRRLAATVASRARGFIHFWPDAARSDAEQCRAAMHRGELADSHPYLVGKILLDQIVEDYPSVKRPALCTIVRWLTEKG